MTVVRRLIALDPSWVRRLPCIGLCTVSFLLCNCKGGKNLPWLLSQEQIKQPSRRWGATSRVGNSCEPAAKKLPTQSLT